MRKIFALTLAVLTVLSMAACRENNENLSSDEVIILSQTVENTETSSDVKTESRESKDNSSAESKDKIIFIDKTGSNKTGTSQKQNTASDGENKEPEYMGISCRKVANDEWHSVKFKNTDNIALRANLPADWSFKKSKDDTYKITRDGKSIGTFTTGSLKKPVTSYEVQNREISDIKVKKQIDRYTEKGKDSYYWYFEFRCSENGKTFTSKLQVNYSELDEDAADTVLYNSLKAPKENSFTPLSKSNGSKEILIIGNSFIGTSQIGSFLSDMLYTSGEGYTVNAVSRGMAEVQHYAADTEMCNAIKSGRYSYVFMCGLYSDTAVNAVGTIKEACEASDTVLVIFPAHNESTEKIDAASNYNSDLYVLNWKNEIDKLISTGIDRSEFCVNDAHNHSTALAGYVGANMIYRSMFKKAPPALTSSAPLSSTEINNKLTDYVNCGGDINKLLRNFYEIK